MDLIKNGKLLCELRKNKGMTQKQLASKLGVVPKTVSKWETGKGFPDVSTLTALSDILGVSERVLLSGQLVKNKAEAGNMKRIKLYVCPYCGNIVNSSGECRIICCGKALEALKPEPADDMHLLKISDVEDDFYIEVNHEMTKAHYIKFIEYIGDDRINLIRLYPEQNASVRFPRMYRGKFYYYCTEHGLFEFKINNSFKK